MIWNTKLTLQQLNEHKDNTLLSALGIEFIEIGNETLTAKMPVDERTVQIFGVLHGGASVALAETIGSTASMMMIDKADDKMPVGVEINANHLKSVKSGWVYGIAKPIRIGRKLHVWQIEIQDDQKNIICISRLTTMIVDITN